MFTLFLNKLVTSVCWAAIVDVPLMQLCEVPRYFFGPQPKWFCFWQVLKTRGHFVLKAYLHEQ
jgi:hypothetical protein